ncbi:glycosyl hydrolase family 32 [Nocardioides sp. KIGAM211]|uniref:Glycosyl hydrolase family 32 n=1 Tax=Nocardioides luti TaxID=2761101 RepID=A0A7X0RH81_9ACTN|nr:glycosyl hydrolase family 32 [Nocardioides luti]
MAFDLADDWVWDFWLADDGAAHHLFFLKAPRSLGDPELRHRNASTGHAVSTDLRSWTRVADALDPQPSPAFDDLATWTGCVVRADDGSWRLFSTGLSRAEDGMVQRVGVSSSDDLVTWKREAGPLLEADPQWYSTRPAGAAETHWRDPWVCRDATGLWHLYATARGLEGDGAVVAHAVSEDLWSWEVRPPLSPPSTRFTWAEVISLHELDGRWVLVFSCLADQMPGAPDGAGGVWAVPVDGPGAPVDLDRATRITSEDLYVGKLARTRAGEHRFLAFQNHDATGGFTGGVIEPVPVAWSSDGTGLVLDGVPRRWLPAEAREF